MSEEGLREKVAQAIHEIRFCASGLGLDEPPSTDDQKDADEILTLVADAFEEHMEDVVWRSSECACDREAMSAVEGFDWLRSQIGTPATEGAAGPAKGEGT